MKIKEILKEEPNIDINIKKLVLFKLLNVNNSLLILKSDEELSTKLLKTYKKIINKYKTGKPIQYILKESYFLGNKFYVDKNVLIPRPETEYLVTKTNELIKKHLKENIKIVDIGTGSGIIAITLKNIDNNYDVTATDICKKALKVAQKNAKIHNACIKFIKGDMLKPLKEQYNVLISNPPYIPYNSENVEDIVKNNEPKKALYAKNNGLYYYEEILKNANKILNKNNIIAFETGENEHDEIIKIVNKYFENAEIIKEKDLNGLERYVFIINKD